MRKLHIKISALTAHFPLKVQDSFKVLSSASSVLLKYCIFAHNFCKLRYIGTCENANFRMPNYIFAKAVTLMNPYLARTMFTSKSTADFAMQNPFKVWSTQEETSRYQFFAHFTLKELKVRIQCFKRELSNDFWQHR